MAKVADDKQGRATPDNCHGRRSPLTGSARLDSNVRRMNDHEPARLSALPSPLNLFELHRRDGDYYTKEQRIEDGGNITPAGATTSSQFRWVPSELLLTPAGTLQGGAGLGAAITAMELATGRPVIWARLSICRSRSAHNPSI